MSLKLKYLREMSNAEVKKKRRASKSENNLVCLAHRADAGDEKAAVDMSCSNRGHSYSGPGDGCASIPPGTEELFDALRLNDYGG